MEKYDENYKADWIITVTSSEANGTAVYNLYGSIDDVKQTLVAFAASDCKNDEHCYEHGCSFILFSLIILFIIWLLIPFYGLDLPAAYNLMLFVICLCKFHFNFADIQPKGQLCLCLCYNHCVYYF